MLESHPQICWPWTKMHSWVRRSDCSAEVACCFVPPEQVPKP